MAHYRINLSLTWELLRSCFSSSKSRKEEKEFALFEVHSVGEYSLFWYLSVKRSETNWHFTSVLCCWTKKYLQKALNENIPLIGVRTVGHFRKIPQNGDLSNVRHGNSITGLPPLQPRILQALPQRMIWGGPNSMSKFHELHSIFVVLSPWLKRTGPSSLSKWTLQSSGTHEQLFFIRDYWEKYSGHKRKVATSKWNRKMMSNWAKSAKSSKQQATDHGTKQSCDTGPWH